MTNPLDDDSRWTAIGEAFAQPVRDALERVQLANADNEFDYFYLSFQPCVEINPEYCIDHHLHEPWYG